MPSDPAVTSAGATATVACTRCKAPAGQPCRAISARRVPLGQIPTWNDGPAQMSHGAHLPRILAYGRTVAR